MKDFQEFRVYQPFENVYHIEDRVNAFATLIVGEKRAVLVDTCTGVGDIRSLVESLTDKPLTVVNTHSHLDHIGGNYQFNEVYLNSREIEEGRIYIKLVDIRENVIRQFASQGFEMEEGAKEKFLSYYLENAKVLSMEEEMDLGGFHLKPVLLPSHTPGMTGFLCRELGLLLGGDSVCIMACLYINKEASLEKQQKMLHDVSTMSFEYILTSHSKELLDRDDFDAIMECADNYDESKTSRFADPYYPQYGGRMYIYESQKHRTAIIVVPKREV